MTHDPIQILVVDEALADRRLVELVLKDQMPDAEIVGIDTPTALAEGLARLHFDAAIVAPRLSWAAGSDILRMLQRVSPNCKTIMFSDEGGRALSSRETAVAPDEYLTKDSAGFLTLPIAVQRQVDSKRPPARFQRALTAGAPLAGNQLIPAARLARGSGGVRAGYRGRSHARPASADLGTEVVRLLQLTDTHLFADPGGRLLGQNTRKTFELVLDLVFARFWPVDRIVMTGDLVHDDHREGYQYLKQRIADLDTPCSCLLGNHDRLRILADTLGGSGISFASSVDCGGWNIVFLDSSVPGSERGHLHRDQLDELEETLRARRQTHTLICLHHQPVRVGSAWLDSMALDNAAEFFAIIDRHPQVRGIVFGHVHQDYRAFRRDVLLLAAPSTCIQFKPRSDLFALDPRTPGFRWFELYPDGRISTGVERITAYPDRLDLTAQGY